MKHCSSKMYAEVAWEHCFPCSKIFASLLLLILQAKTRKGAEAKPIISVDMKKKVAIYTAEGVAEKVVPLQKGPRGFCGADFGFPDGPVETEVPNLLFDAERLPPKKRPAAASKNKNSSR